MNQKITITLLATSIIVPSSLATTISYPNFSDKSELQLNGSTAVLAQPPNALRLTDTTGQGGSAFYKTAVPLTDLSSSFDASFSTYFSFQITDPVGSIDADDNQQGADGLVFVVQTQSNTAGGAGGGIGYSGIAKSVGVEFDTWDNGGVDDGNGNHVGINVGGDIDSVAQANVTPLFNNGQVWHAWVDYNGTTDLLEVRWGQSDVRPLNAQLTHTVDLVSVLTVPNAYVGFTSGTGSAGGDHDILEWTFVSDYAPIGTPDGGTTAMLLGFGLAGLMMARKPRH